MVHFNTASVKDFDLYPAIHQWNSGWQRQDVPVLGQSQWGVGQWGRDDRGGDGCIEKNVFLESTQNAAFYMHQKKTSPIFF